jgi:hypothetical protein
MDGHGPSTRSTYRKDHVSMTNMKRFFLSALSLILVAACLPNNARGQIAVPRFGYTNTDLTRGFYFQAPLDFQVTGVEVPDESNKGKQMFAIYVLKSEPPAHPSSVSVTPIQFASNVNSGQQIPLSTPVQVKKGEWFCVLGACGGSTGTVANSYGTTAPYVSSVLGSNITLYRLAMQANIAGNLGKGKLSNDKLGKTDPYGSPDLGRVFVSVVGAGQQTSFGGPIGSTSDKVEADTSQPPNISRSGGVIVTSGGGANRGGILALAFRKANLPIPGWGTLYLGAPYILIPLPNPIPAKGALTSIALPNQTSLLGAKVFFQGVIDHITSTRLTANGMEWKIGR